MYGKNTGANMSLPESQKIDALRFLYAPARPAYANFVLRQINPEESGIADKGRDPDLHGLRFG
jgi:hypothetical protein